MSEPQKAIDALNQAFSFKYHSLAGYIAQAAPYVGKGQESAMEYVKTITEEDRVEADRLLKRLEGLEGIPQAGTALLDVASVNYLAIDYLLGVLLKNLEGQLEFYESQLGHYGDPIQEDFDRLAATTRRHVEEIRVLMKPGQVGQ